ncbi:MAG: hypothetical protein MUP69_10750 [Candidatus Atribacteria bacterium]|nr:hypothetical protein [Candidatus Atribacteria bacterium]
MYVGYIQNLRHKLEKRVEKLQLTDWRTFHFSLKQFWGFLKSYPIFVGILEDLEHNCPYMETDAEKIVRKNEVIQVDDELENAALSYFVFKNCYEDFSREIEMKIGAAYLNEGIRNNNENYMLEQFKLSFLKSLYDYLDEAIDDQRAMLYFLTRYKHKCEWFQRKNLYESWSSCTIKGESSLAYHLYEYLYDQGLDFFIEPSSIKGRIDMISTQKNDDPLLVEIKIFFPKKGKGKSYIAKGFNQIYQYTLKFNKSFGYLVIYNVSGKDLRFGLNKIEESIPFMMHNNKTIFFITIDIFPYKNPPSKSGFLETIEITEENLIRFVKEEKKIKDIIK